MATKKELPRTPLALAVMNLLIEQPMHPYEMKSKMKERGHDQVIKLTGGSIYDTVERLEPLDVAHGGLDQERREHHQHRHHQERDRAHQHIEDRLGAEQPPAARLHHVVGAVEPDAQALDAVRGEIDGEDGADHDGAARPGVLHRGLHLAHVARDRRGDFARPGAEQNAAGLDAEVARADGAGERVDQDQEREHRREDREGDVARDRPAVGGEEMREGIERNLQIPRRARDDGREQPGLGRRLRWIARVAHRLNPRVHPMRVPTPTPHVRT